MEITLRSMEIALQKKEKRLFALKCAGLLAVLLFLAFYNGLITKKYTLNTDKLPAGESVRVVLITDLHSHVYGVNQSKIISLIKKQKPDIIALAGDIIDDVAPIKGALLFLKGIKGIAPVYYVTGNHEFWSNDIKNIKDIIRNLDINILENSYEQIRVKNAYIIIGGVDDPEVVRYDKPNYNWMGEMHKTFSELDNKSGFKILLAHRPELIEEYKKNSFDLVLSGHAHGGQIRLPFILNGLFAPNQGWFPDYAGGVYKHGTLTHIVSRGVSYDPRMPRVFNPPEVVVINIKGISAAR